MKQDCTVKDNNDISLVKRVAVFHDKRAFDVLVRKYQSPVRRFFMGHTSGDVQLSDDLAQDTFIKAYTHIGTFRAQSGFRTWLYRIACNVLYDYTRRHRQSESIEANRGLAESGVGTPESLRLDIYRAMNVLSSDERTCITLQLMDGMSLNEISGITGMPEGTVKSHLSRGKNKLANYLKKNGYNGKK